MGRRTGHARDYVSVSSRSFGWATTATASGLIALVAVRLSNRKHTNVARVAEPVEVAA